MRKLSSLAMESGHNMVDFSLPAKDKHKHPEKKEQTREDKEVGSFQELYLQRMIDRFGILPDDSPVVKEVQNAVELFKPFLNVDVKRVVVINSGESNARVFIGGDTIFVGRGIIEYLIDTSQEGNCSLDQIVGVCAHEIGHLERGTGEILDEKGGKSDVNHKELEYDADRFAIRLLEQSGFNPLEYVKTMEALNRLTGQEGAYSSSHPRSYKRMTDIEAILRSPETVASITRPTTPLSSEFVDSLKKEGTYPHVDDQILNLETPESLQEVMASFDNVGDQVEWMQHYILYEKYRIAREQIETNECKQDMDYEVLFSNLRYYLDSYISGRENNDSSSPGRFESETPRLIEKNGNIYFFG